MADEPETPADARPAPRRHPPRKTSDSRTAPKPPARRKPGPKSTGDTVAEAVIDAAREPVATVTSTARKAAEAVKTRSTKRATPRMPAKKDQTMPKHPETTPPKANHGWGAAAIAGGLGAAATIAVLSLRGSSRRAKAASGAHQPDGTDSSASFAAGIADENTVPGGAAASAAPATGGAHQADGSDATASFDAGIADEGTIPD